MGMKDLRSQLVSQSGTLVLIKMTFRIDSQVTTPVLWQLDWLFSLCDVGWGRILEVLIRSEGRWSWQDIQSSCMNWRDRKTIGSAFNHNLHVDLLLTRHGWHVPSFCTKYRLWPRIYLGLWTWVPSCLPLAFCYFKAARSYMHKVSSYAWHIRLPNVLAAPLWCWFLLNMVYGVIALALSLVRDCAWGCLETIWQSCKKQR